MFEQQIAHVTSDGRENDCAHNPKQEHVHMISVLSLNFVANGSG